MRLLGGLLIAASLYAQAGFFPLADIRPGMQGTGRTVFSADRVEDFQVEIRGSSRTPGRSSRWSWRGSPVVRWLRRECCKG